MEIKIYFEGKEDVKVSIEVLENLYEIAKDDYKEALDNGSDQERCNRLDECDVLAHLVATLKNSNHDTSI